MAIWRGSAHGIQQSTHRLNEEDQETLRSTWRMIKKVLEELCSAHLAIQLASVI